MTRQLREISAADVGGLVRALRDALSGGGSAILPRDARAPGAHSDIPREVAHNIALVIETSGSTGVPKRVAISTDALLASAAASASALGGAGQWLLALPAHYIAGAQVLVRSIAAETEPVVLAAGHFDPAVFAEHAAALTAELRFVSVVPVQLARLLDAAEHDRALLTALRRFDGILVGGQALRPDLHARALKHRLAIRRTYGSSETCGGCVYDGVPIGNTRVRASGGQLEIAGSVLAEGYLGDLERTSAVFVDDPDSGRWYRTGDLGDVVDGVVRVTGRVDDMIVSGGQNVSLGAVERRVREFPGFEDAIVIAGASEKWGQVPVVVVAGHASAPLDRLRAHVAAQLGKAAAPGRVVAVERIPMLASGKPDRRALAALL